MSWLGKLVQRLSAFESFYGNVNINLKDSGIIVLIQFINSYFSYNLRNFSSIVTIEDKFHLYVLSWSIEDIILLGF